MIRDKIRFMMNCKGPLHYNKLIYVSTWDEESGKDITRRKKYIKSAYKWTTMTLEKRMAAHSIILAWRIPWTEEPGGYSPWGHKESDMTEWLTHTHTTTWATLYLQTINSGYEKATPEPVSRAEALSVDIPDFLLCFWILFLNYSIGN